MSRVHNVLALFALFALAGAANAATTPEGVAYLQANKLKDGVIELPSGLQYRVLVEGPAGGPSPGPSTRCACHYRGTTIDGKEFDSSYKRGKPTEFAPNQVIAGWTEAMQLMKEGDKWELVIERDRVRRQADGSGHHPRSRTRVHPRDRQGGGLNEIARGRNEARGIPPGGKTRGLIPISPSPDFSIVVDVVFTPLITQR